MKRIIIFLIVIIVAPQISCRVKKCPRFDGEYGGRRIEYKKNGLVKKKGVKTKKF
ncbi:MAG: hypothetical protein H3C45_03610 [Bacteroidia bacterium]|nr:hypothetical protein [Bacteroidia bacterium]MCC7534042.1 hypothetical protein [Bacteroidia bacterium]MCZ2141777.1 hypothetical protein [Bacteroidia bacterium]